MKALGIGLAALAAVFTASAASAATVYTYTGTTFHTDRPFEAIFRFDTPYKSFTFLIDGRSFGFDDTQHPVHIRHDNGGTTYISLRRSFVGLDGVYGGQTYLRGRFTFGTGWDSAVTAAGRPLVANLSEKLRIDNLTITTEPDLAPGYLDLSGAYRVFPPYVPEPSTWALLLLGFGVTGAALRRRRQEIRPHRQCAAAT